LVALIVHVLLYNLRKCCIGASHNNLLKNVVVIVEKIKDIRATFYRPKLPQEESEGVHPNILALMKQCWAEEPTERPLFDEIARILKKINKGKLVLDLLLFVLVSYAL